MVQLIKTDVEEARGEEARGEASPPGMSRTPGFIATPDGKIAGGWPAENK
jgi:hypothetical protein